MAKGSPRKTSRNPELAPGIRRYGRVAARKKRAAQLHHSKGDTGKGGKGQGEGQGKGKGGKGEGGATPQESSSSILVQSRWYTADDIKRPLKSRKVHHHQPKIRKSLSPGTIIIILAGRFRGKRVVLLKHLTTSGLLLVTGPYKINGVPLRRVNPSYVIATGTTIDVSQVDLTKIDDEFFSKTEKRATKNEQGQFITQPKKEKVSPSSARKSEQSRVDGIIRKVVDSTPNLYHYLNSKFSLTNGQKPHLLSF